MGEIEELVIALRFFANARHNGGRKEDYEAMPGSVVGLACKEISLWVYLYRAADALERLKPEQAGRVWSGRLLT